MTKHRDDPERFSNEDEVVLVKAAQVAALKRVAAAGKCPVCGRGPTPTTPSPR
jgi:hypothetical protein